MKWDKAINKIEKALAEGANVAVHYHRKWMKNDSHLDDVESISKYEWNGQICKAVNTFHDQLNESSHIIDEVLADYFFNTRLGKDGE